MFDLIAAALTRASAHPNTSPGDTCLWRYCFDASSAGNAAARIGLVITLAVVGRYLVHRVINRAVRRTTRGLPLPLHRLRGRARELLEFTNEIPAVNERRDQRAKTVGAVLNSIVTAVLFGTAAVMIMRELGLDITPVLTSAGIAGVAVGFGAQNLVKDFLSGMFMILEDQYGVGDVIDVGPATGMVETVGMRTTRLRDVNGTVWHVRNGEIIRVGNMSQNWSRAVLDIPVGYDADLDRVSELVKAVADSVWRDPDWSEAVLEEPELWGVEQFGEYALALRLVVKTAPLKQWDVAREIRARLKNALDAAGLDIPLAQRALWVRGGSAADGEPPTDLRGDAGADPDGERQGPRPRSGPGQGDGLRP